MTHAGMGVAGTSTSGEAHLRHPGQGKARTPAKKKERKKASALRAAAATPNALERCQAIANAVRDGKWAQVVDRPRDPVPVVCLYQKRKKATQVCEHSDTSCCNN